MAAISIRTSDAGVMPAYLAMPGTLPAPTVVVLQEIFGVNAAMRAVADDFAARGYIAVVPDLFWRQAPGIELDPANAEDRDRAVGHMKALDPQLAIADCQAAISHARAIDGATGKAGVVGFCLGGRLAYVLAAKSDADAAVAYYGVGLETMLDLMPAMRAPLLLHIGGADHLCGPDQRQAILAAVADKPDIVAHVYPGASHAFRRPGGENYRAEAAELADARTFAFLNRFLG